MLKTKSNEDEVECYGDVVTGGYNRTTKKWHIHYDESDAESEDLSVDEILEDLRNASLDVIRDRPELVNAIFVDDEDESLSYMVSEVNITSEFKSLACCFCVPYEGDIEKAKEIATMVKKNREYLDENVFAIDYVRDRVHAYRQK